MFQRAEAPKSPDGKPRYQNAAVAGGGGFFAAICLVLAWDVPASSELTRWPTFPAD